MITTGQLDIGNGNYGDNNGGDPMPGMWRNLALTLLYTITFLFGFMGNAWVLTSVWRSRRLASCRGSIGGAITQAPKASNRLRHYISLLAFVDTLVTLSLLFRIVFTALPQASVDALRCQCIHMIDQLVKLSSLGCLACISLERYITIRKPFSSPIRHRVIFVAPYAILGVLFCSLVSILLQSVDIAPIEEGMNCGVVRRQTSGKNSEDGAEENFLSLQFDVTSWLITLTFLLFLTTITANYTQILLHVKHTFWQRKCRSYENQLRRLSAVLLAPSQSSNVQEVRNLLPASTLIALSKGQNGGIVGRKLTPLPEPRYMRHMTATIVRIAVFHTLCWLPYCVLQVLPYRLSSSHHHDGVGGVAEGEKEYSHLTTNVRFLELSTSGPIPGYRLMPWMELMADWLSYAGSAGNWVFYAAMNRELRALIKATAERRKRSTFSFSPQPSTGLVRRTSSFRTSLQKQMNLGLRLFYSLNSLRASGDAEADVAAGGTATAACFEAGHAPLVGFSASARGSAAAAAGPAPSDPRIATSSRSADYRATPKSSIASPSLGRGSSWGSEKGNKAPKRHHCGGGGDDEEVEDQATQQRLFAKRKISVFGPFNDAWTRGVGAVASRVANTRQSHYFSSGGSGGSSGYGTSKNNSDEIESAGVQTTKSLAFYFPPPPPTSTPNTDYADYNPLGAGGANG